MTLVPLLATVVRVAFVSATAPALGSVLLLAVGRLTGARWPSLGGIAALSPWLGLGAVALAAAQATVAPPPHLAGWMAWWAVGARAFAAAALLAFAARLLARRESATAPALVLTGVTLLATPLGADWMLAEAPGHPVSAIGMMLAVEAVGGAAALVLASGRGEPRERADLTKLLIAAALGLAYLTFMDYLIVWFGNLPARVGFYAARGTPGMAELVVVALLVGVAGPIACAAGRRQRAAGVCGCAGLLLFNIWWIGGGRG